jgi:hypothetical protein
MVLTIMTYNSSYTILFLIRSQINNYKSLGRHCDTRVADSNYELFKLGCFSMYFQLSGYTIQQQRPLYKISGVLHTVAFMNKAGFFTLGLVNGQAFSCSCQGILVQSTHCRGPRQFSKLFSIIRQ